MATTVHADAAAGSSLLHFCFKSVIFVTHEINTHIGIVKGDARFGLTAAGFLGQSLPTTPFKQTSCNAPGGEESDSGLKAC